MEARSSLKECGLGYTTAVGTQYIYGFEQLLGPLVVACGSNDRFTEVECSRAFHIQAS